MAKAAEKLIILGDIASGLLARIHNIYEFKKPALFDPDLDRYCKAVVKKFPNLTETEFKKVPGEVFAKRATEIREALSDYYRTFLDVLNFKDEAWKLLTELANTIVSFKFSLNIDLMSYFLNLLTRYINLHLLVNRVKDKKLFLGAYARAYHVTHGNPETRFHEIATFLAKYEKDELKVLATDCEPLSRRVGETLLGFAEPVHKWSEVKKLVDERIFNVVTEPKHMCLPIGEKNHNELIHVARMKYWVLIGFLVCPAKLEEKAALDLLMLCLNDTFSVTIFRDVQFNIHEEYEKLFGWYKVGKFKLSKHKKLLKGAANWEQTMFTHHQLRVYLRVEMDTLCHFFSEFPGTIAPKIQMVYAALHLARDELLWYFRHMSVTHKSKRLQLKADHRITDLIYLTYQLDSLVQKYKASVQTYYLEFLSGRDAKHVQPVVQKFLSEAKASQGNVKLLELIMAGVQGKTIDDNFEALRLNWYRVSAAINHQQSGVSTQLTEQLSSAMNRIITHSRNVDCVDTQLRTHGSFKSLYWYRAGLHMMLKECLGGQANSRNALSLVKVLSHALDNVHRICPEEQPEIGKASVILADQFLRTIVMGVEKLLLNITNTITGLRMQTGPRGILARVGKDSSSAGPLPGIESSNPNHKDIAPLKSWKKSLAAILAAIQETDQITVYNIRFVPREYLIETVQKTIRTSLRQSCMVDAKHIQRPSVALARFKDIIYAYQTIEHYVSINLSTLVREVLLTEFTDPRCGNVGESLYQDRSGDVKDEKEKQGTMIHDYARWFRGLFQQHIADVGVVYSGVKQCFVGFPVIVSGESKVLYDTETKTDLNELKSLCTLIGPYGVRVIEKELLDVIKSNVSTIKDILVRCKPVLEAVKGHFTEMEHWMAARKKIADVDLDSLILRTTIIGCILEFRKILRQALRLVTESSVGFIFQTVKLAFDHTHDVVKCTGPEFAALDFLASDCGIDIRDADHAMKLTLREYKNQPTDAALWGLLPEIYGMAMAAPKWRGAKYVILAEGHLNNSHTMVPAIHSLIATFHGIAGPTEIGPDVRIQQDIERFVYCASYSLIHHALSTKQPSLINDSMVFLEQFILASGGRLHLSILEECFPFTLIRTNFIRIYEQQSSKGKRYALATDEEKEAS